MKLILFITVFSLIVFSCNEPEQPVYQPVLKDKTVTFQIYTYNDYNQPGYENAKVKFSFWIKKITFNPYKETVELDTILGWMAFRDVPSELNKIYFSKTIPDIDENRENIQFGYSWNVDFDGKLSS
jgi:hypothetical protein